MGKNGAQAKHTTDASLSQVFGRKFHPAFRVLGYHGYQRALGELGEGNEP